MSGFANRLRVGTMLSRGVFNRSAVAGPRRLLVIAGVGVTALAVIVVVASTGHKVETPSVTARMHNVNELPGGMQSTPQQDKLALQTDQEQAAAAARRGQSYTPPINASAPVNPAGDMPPMVVPQPTPARDPNAGLHVATAPQPVAVTPHVQYASAPVYRQVADTPVDPNAERMYAQAIDRLLRGWDGRTPRTVVSVEPDQGSDPGSTTGGTGGVRSASYNAAERNTAPSTTRTVIMPAGRGVYAHTVLAASSDNIGPVVLQADSGPLAGDRMIGQFSTATSNGGEADRLVVRVISIEHHGKTVTCDGIVTAPDTMETTVASSVDEHYVSRFLLPAAAAFVQGLGSAIATTSNTIGTVSPFGGTSYTTQLNFPQQLGVGAGAAAQQVGTTLNREAPRGPTVHLDANANVGVMFLTPVVDNGNG